jgi:hypothetical protein
MKLLTIFLLLMSLNLQAQEVKTRAFTIELDDSCKIAHNAPWKLLGGCNNGALLIEYSARSYTKKVKQIKDKINSKITHPHLSFKFKDKECSSASPACYVEGIDTQGKRQYYYYGESNKFVFLISFNVPADIESSDNFVRELAGKLVKAGI